MCEVESTLCDDGEIDLDLYMARNFTTELRFVNEACFNDANMLDVDMSGSAFHGARFIGTRLGSNLSDSKQRLVRFKFPGC